MIGIIPCRFKSTRFPGKPLVDIGDKPMMWHVYQQASKASELDKVYIATDDFRIEDACKHLGMNVLMTQSTHLTGTDRVAECAEQLNAASYVNIQGDEPFIDPESINAIARALKEADDPTIMATNAYTKIDNPSEATCPNVVKVIFDTQSNAMAYSRSAIPYSLREAPIYYRQLGLYAFRKTALEAFTQRNQGPLEKMESVEMLRYLEYGDKVKMVEVVESGIAVDTPEDLVVANAHYANLNSKENA